MSVTSALLAGIVAGLGVAVPLGAIGVLLLQTGLVAGWRVGAAGALGVALVDLAYAGLVVTAGAAVAEPIARHSTVIRLVGSAVLFVVAAIGLRSVLRPGSASSATNVGLAAPPGTAPGAVLARFVGLTALNPLTAVYFAALVAGFSGRFDAIGRIAFVAGVFAASLAWQLVLITVGATTGHRASPRMRGALGLAGALLVAAYAVRLAVGE
ncbi:MAG TPA: LysE family transporter [Actinomycetes bacterium]|nr:LysE family transporter [Actinomycetes bacterium]